MKGTTGNKTVAATRYVSRSEQETVAIGRRIGELLRTRSARRTVLLRGELGSGKTTFVKGIASAFGIAERDVCSASFVIVAQYDSTPPLYHIDLYRLGSREEIEDVGIGEYIGTDGVAVIEWPDLLEEDPADAMTIRIAHLDDTSREIIIEGIDEGL